MLVAARGSVPQQARLEPSKPKQVCVPLGNTHFFATVMARFRLFCNTIGGTQAGSLSRQSYVVKAPLSSISIRYLSAHCTKFAPIASVTGSTTASEEPSLVARWVQSNTGNIFKPQ